MVSVALLASTRPDLSKEASKELLTFTVLHVLTLFDNDPFRRAEYTIT